MANQLKPLHHVFAESNMQIVDGLYRAAEQAISETKEVLSVFQQVKNGELDISRVVVNDDGCKVMPEPPKVVPKPETKKDA